MKKTTAHAIEDLTIDLNMVDWHGHITIVLRKKENALITRPNAFELVRGKKGWTRCRQCSYYYSLNEVFGHEGLYIYKYDRKGEILNGNREDGGSYHKVDYREYTDAEILEILDGIRKTGLTMVIDGSYEVNA